MADTDRATTQNSAEKEMADTKTRHFTQKTTADKNRRHKKTAVGETHAVLIDSFDVRQGGNPTSHTPAHNVPAVAAAFRL